MVKGVHRYGSLHGKWEYFLAERDHPKSIERARLAIGRWKADGIIAHVSRPWIQQLVRSSGLPAVNFSGVRDLEMPTVKTDDAAVGQMGARHFLDSGFRNFGFCELTPEAYARGTCEGFCRELFKGGFSCNVLINRRGSPGDWRKTGSLGSLAEKACGRHVRS